MYTYIVYVASIISGIRRYSRQCGCRHVHRRIPYDMGHGLTKALYRREVTSILITNCPEGENFSSCLWIRTRVLCVTSDLVTFTLRPTVSVKYAGTYSKDVCDLGMQCCNFLHVIFIRRNQPFHLHTFDILL